MQHLIDSVEKGDSFAVAEAVGMHFAHHAEPSAAKGRGIKLYRPYTMRESLSNLMWNV